MFELSKLVAVPAEEGEYEAEVHQLQSTAVFIQDAFPAALLTRTFPTPCVPSAIFTFPATSNFAVGEGFPIQVLPPEVNIPAVRPSNSSIESTSRFHDVAERVPPQAGAVLSAVVSPDESAAYVTLVRMAAIAKDVPDITERRMDGQKFSEGGMVQKD